MTRRQITAVFGSALLVAVISLLPVACGGGGGGGEGTPTPTRVPMTTCKPTTPVVPSTPTDLPAGFTEYLSPERGYRVRYPSDWTVEPDMISVGNMAGDAFFSATLIGGVKPNISVSCETIPVGTSSQQFLDSKLAAINKLSGQKLSVGANLTVDGKEAFLVKHKVTGKDTPQPLTVDKVDIFFADDLGGWTLSLVAPVGTADAYGSALDAFVASFRGP